MKRYWIDEETGRVRAVKPATGDHICFYMADDVDAALAAKDAAIARLLGTLRVIAKNTDPDDPESYRFDDREGCLDDMHASAKMAIAAVNDLAPHPDAVGGEDNP